MKKILPLCLLLLCNYCYVQAHRCPSKLPQSLCIVQLVKANQLMGFVSPDTVVIMDSLNYQVPSAFTPNGDGLNDCFGVRYWSNVSQIDFSIYDRLGNQVFHTTDPMGCWDGTNKGQQAETANYIYYIKATVPDGVIQRRGNVLLIR